MVEAVTALIIVGAALGAGVFFACVHWTLYQCCVTPIERKLIKRQQGQQGQQGQGARTGHEMHEMRSPGSTDDANGDFAYSHSMALPDRHSPTRSTPGLLVSNFGQHRIPQTQAQTVTQTIAEQQQVFFGSDFPFPSTTGGDSWTTAGTGTAVLPTAELLTGWPAQGQPQPQPQNDEWVTWDEPGTTATTTDTTAVGTGVAPDGVLRMETRGSIHLNLPNANAAAANAANAGGGGDDDDDYIGVGATGGTYGAGYAEPLPSSGPLRPVTIKLATFKQPFKQPQELDMADDDDMFMIGDGDDDDDGGGDGDGEVRMQSTGVTTFQASSPQQPIAVVDHEIRLLQDASDALSRANAYQHGRPLSMLGEVDEDDLSRGPSRSGSAVSRTAMSGMAKAEEARRKAEQARKHEQEQADAAAAAAAAARRKAAKEATEARVAAEAAERKQKADRMAEQKRRKDEAEALRKRQRESKNKKDKKDTNHDLSPELEEQRKQQEALRRAESSKATALHDKEAREKEAHALGAASREAEEKARKAKIMAMMSGRR